MGPEEVVVQIKRLPGNDDIPLPAYQSEAAVGMDLHAAVQADTELAVGEILLVPCGFSLAIPVGHEAQIRPRSGLAAKQGIGVINSPGTIDPDYRGELKVALINLGKVSVRVTRGMRIAQIVVLPVPRVRWQLTDDLLPTERNVGGFGHTGQ